MCASFVDIFLLFMFHVYLRYAVLSVPCSLVTTCWERADLLAILCVVLSCVFVTFHMVFWVRYSTDCIVVSIPDLCLPFYLYLGHDARNPVFEGLRTTQAQTSLRIRAV